MSLAVSGLGVRYGRTVAVEQCDLEVRPGAAVALLGSNGAGKTSVCRAISGVVKTDRGRVTVDGETTTGEAAEALVARGVVQVPEGRALFPNLTVYDNLKLGGFTVSAADLDKGIESAYETFPVLRERSRFKAGSLSGGEQQMLAIARALMVSPRYLILDELSLGLAPLAVERLYALLDRVKQSGVGILVVEQSVQLALRNTDHAHVLYKGKTVHSGPSDELARDMGKVWQAYTGTIERGAAASADGGGPVTTGSGGLAARRRRRIVDGLTVSDDDVPAKRAMPPKPSRRQHPVASRSDPERNGTRPDAAVPRLRIRIRGELPR